MNTEITDRPMSERLPEYLFTSIHEALGAASMCWIPQPGSQVFDSNRAGEIALELCRDVADWYDNEMSELIEARKVIAAAEGKLTCSDTREAGDEGACWACIARALAHYRSLYPEATRD